MERLILVGASPGLADEQERAARRAADDALADRIETLEIEAFAREWGAQPLFADQPERVAAGAHADRLRNTPQGLAAALRGLGTGVMEPLWDRLPELQIPVTLVVGERDEKFSALAERMLARLPDARLVVVAGAGHAAQLEDPGAVAEAIRVDPRSDLQATQLGAGGAAAALGRLPVGLALFVGLGVVVVVEVVL